MRNKSKLTSIILLGIMLFFINLTTLFASSASISVSASKSKVVVGDTVTVTIKAKSSDYIGTWEFTPSYDKARFKLTSGKDSVVYYGKTKEKSYTYKFKAISSGTGTFTVKSVSIRDYKTEKEMSVSKGSTSVKVLTKSQLEATYSKNNNLKSLSVSGLKLSPSFSKNTTTYRVTANANTTKVTIKASVADSKSKVSGTGTKSVSEGENKFNIVVTAQNGSKKTYTIIVNVIDPNPIEVTIGENKYTVIKRESNIPKVDDYKKQTTKVNNQTVPCLYNETNDYTLLALKDKEGNIVLGLYNKEDDTFSLYEDASLTQMNIVPLEIDKDYKKDQERTTVTIDNVEFEAIKLSASGMFIVKARDLDTAKENFYEYDEETNTLIRYVEDEEVKPDTSKDQEIKKYKKMLVLLGIETITVIIILIIILIVKMRKNKLRKKRLQEEREKQEKEKKEKEEKQTKITKKSTKKKEVKKDEEKKNN